MKTTLSIIKADIGSIGGHIKPSERLLKRVEEYVADEWQRTCIRFLCVPHRRRHSNTFLA